MPEHPAPGLKDAEAAAREVAGIIESVTDRLPGNWGFCLFLFTFGERGSATYISNAQREDMINALQELIEHWKKEQEETRH